MTVGFFLVLAVAFAVTSLPKSRAVRLVCAGGTVLGAALMLQIAGLLAVGSELEHNIWYSGAASKMLKAYIAELEAGRPDAVLQDLKHMNAELEVTYERRGDFKDLAENAEARLKKLADSSRAPARN